MVVRNLTEIAMLLRKLFGDVWTTCYRDIFRYYMQDHIGACRENWFSTFTETKLGNKNPLECLFGKVNHYVETFLGSCIETSFLDLISNQNSVIKPAYRSTTVQYTKMKRWIEMSFYYYFIHQKRKHLCKLVIYLE